ncbi:DNA repair protein RecO [Flavobacterium sp. CYK-4]|uniref:DNA repair protein RecO n=1 Tax=Flavobacterium lotistagni TaxID=2709660 RepID=UPI00140B494C|nr:DNA repair protein RecO [Flavobacterium lotistagni]NHM06044.1 DNA repair protein RecO [Flavobacterium lotistagni]
MLVKTQAIVLSTLKFQEKSLIVKCFTKSDGMKSYFVRDAFSSRKSAARMAYFQPLSILEIEAVHKNKGSLEYFKEIKIAQPFQTIHSDITKSAIAMFLSEMLLYSIGEEEKNEALFEFLQNALQWFDYHESVANFHLILLLEITKHLGFYPEVSSAELPFFEMSEGIFVPFFGTTALNEAETLNFKKLLELRFDNNQPMFSVSDRKQLLKNLIDYYGLHLEGFKKPKSLDVLSAIFL